MFNRNKLALLITVLGLFVAVLPAQAAQPPVPPNKVYLPVIVKEEGPNSATYEMLIEGDAGLYALWAPTGSGINAVVICDDCFDGAFSPDGSRVAFVRWADDGGTDIWVMNADGSGKKNLTNSVGIMEAHPTWSADGSHLAYQRWTEEEEMWIYLLEVEVGKTSPVAQTPGVAAVEQRRLDLLAVGRATRKAGAKMEAMALNELQEVSKLAKGLAPVWAGISPAWCPTCPFLGFGANITTGTPEDEYHWAFFSANFCGGWDVSPAVRLEVALAGDIYDPKYSPKRDYELFWATDPTPGLYKVGSFYNITNLDPAGVGGAISPDGGKIAYVSQIDWNIWLMNADGSGKSNVSHHTEGQDIDPAWAPDGRRVAYVWNRRGVPGGLEIYVYNVDSGQTTQWSWLDEISLWGPVWRPTPTSTPIPPTPRALTE